LTYDAIMKLPHAIVLGPERIDAMPNDTIAYQRFRHTHCVVVLERDLYCPFFEEYGFDMREHICESISLKKFDPPAGQYTMCTYPIY
jgi:hypothetical protein